MTSIWCCVCMCDVVGTWRKHRQSDIKHLSVFGIFTERKLLLIVTPTSNRQSMFPFELNYSSEAYGGRGFIHFFPPKRSYCRRTVFPRISVSRKPQHTFLMQKCLLAVDFSFDVDRIRDGKYMNRLQHAWLVCLNPCFMRPIFMHVHEMRNKKVFFLAKFAINSSQ